MHARKILNPGNNTTCSEFLWTTEGDPMLATTVIRNETVAILLFAASVLVVAAIAFTF